MALKFDDNLNLIDAATGNPVPIGTEVYSAERGHLGMFIRVGPERGQMGGIVVWFDAPWDKDLPDGKMRATCYMVQDTWTTRPMGSQQCSAPGSLDTSLSHAAGLIEIAACHA